MDGRLKRPIEEVRAELLADAHTQQIAKNLGVDLEEYVEEVLFFATHPDEEPELRYLEDENWIEKGITPATEEAITRWLKAGARPDGFHRVKAQSAVAPKHGEAVGQVIAQAGAARGIEKQIVHARMDMRMDLERMRAQRGAKR